MPGPAALIALAARLGIPKAASYTYKKLKKLVSKAQKKKTTKQTEAEKGYRGQGSKRKQEKINKRKADNRAQILTNLEKKNVEKRKLLSKLKTDLEISKKEVREAAYKNVNKRKN